MSQLLLLHFVLSVFSVSNIKHSASKIPLHDDVIYHLTLKSMESLFMGGYLQASSDIYC